MSTPFVPGVPKDEAKYKRMVELGKMLGLPVQETFISVVAKAPNGEITGEYAGRSRTVNRNYWNGLLIYLTYPTTSSGSFGAGTYVLKHTGGSLVNLDPHTYSSNGGNAYGPIFDQAGRSSGTAYATNNTGFGIRLGTGTDAESFEGHTLAAIIAHGTGAGQLQYSSLAVQTATYNAGSKVWTNTLARNIVNGSGATINVNESGVIVDLGSSSGMLITRDVFGAPVAVLNGGSIVVTYTYTLTFPA